MTDNNLFGNLTTIVNFLSLAIFPYVSIYGITQDQLTALLCAVIGILFAYVNAKHPNTFGFLGNDPVHSEVQKEKIIETNDLLQEEPTMEGMEDGC